MIPSFGKSARTPWPEQFNTAAAFAVPGLALWLASGYSYGAALMLLGALATLHRWVRAPQQALTWWFFASMLAMGLLWVAQADPTEHWGQADRPLKFVLASACLLYATVFPPRPRAFLWGLIVGCIGASAIAIWQVHVQGAWRASGHTNAIQYGNLALLMAVLLAIYGVCIRRQLSWGVKLLCVVAIAAGMHASVLSLARGGWLALIVAMPFGLALLYRMRRSMFWKVVVALAVLTGVLSVANRELVSQRWDEMTSEIQVYSQKRDASTSVGQRLEHWRLAVEMGAERPLLGWGVADYTAEKKARVAQGKYHPGIVEYKFVHNEVLDVFVKTGLAGLAVLMFFYCLPIWMFWPSARRTDCCRQNAALCNEILALRLCGVCVPVLYMGFGLTQVFFAHNSGIMFYLFSLILLWSALLGLERQARRETAQAAPQP